MGFTGRIQAVSNRLKGKIRESLSLKKTLFFLSQQKTGLGLLCIFTAIILGFWANKAAEEEALSQWEKIHFPSDSIVNHILESHHFKSITNPKLLGQMSRLIPPVPNENYTFFIDNSENAIIFYSLQRGAPDPVIFCIECPKRRQDWKNLGAGWKGLEQVIQILEHQKKKNQAADHRKPSPPPDPRAIIY